MSNILLTWHNGYVWNEIIKSNSFLEDNLILFEWDIQNPDSFKKYYKNKIDIILNLAVLNNRSPRLSWKDEKSVLHMYQKINIDSISDIALLANETNASVLNFSSVNVNDLDENVLKLVYSWEEKISNILKACDLKQTPNLLYSLSKIISEYKLKKILDKKSTSLRLPSISSKEWNVVQSFIKKIKSWEKIEINNNSNFDFILIEDVLDLIWFFTWRDIKIDWNIYNIWSWWTITLDNLVQLISNLLNDEKDLSLIKIIIDKTSKDFIFTPIFQQIFSLIKRNSYES